MKHFGRFYLALAFIVFSLVAHSQDFLEKEIAPGKTYILLVHPTVQNLETIQFLLKNNLLQVHDADFVGVYSSEESYDFGQSAELIEKEGMSRFHLQKVSGKEDVAHIYQQNGWTATFRKLLDISSGIFFFGGPDIQPEAYGQKNLYSEVTDPNRHLFELSFLFQLLGGRQNNDFVPFLKAKPEYFVTGFCLGLQSMNVATGGTLIQDIPAQKYEKMNAEETLKLKKEQLHRNYWQEISGDTLLMGINFHPVQFTADPFFLKRVKAEKDFLPTVLSSHHQAIDELGKDLIVTATSLDNEVIEGIHHRVYPNVFAVQFHPEVPALYQKSKKLKFAPTDEPKSYFEIIGGQSRAFHQKYWAAISEAIRSSVKAWQKK